MAGTGVGTTGVLLKSVTLFLSGRRTSASNRPAPQPSSKKARLKTDTKKKMGDDKSLAASNVNNNKSTVKLIDSLKRQTRFSRCNTRDSSCVLYRSIMLYEDTERHRRNVETNVGIVIDPFKQEIEALCKVYKKLIASNTVKVAVTPSVAIAGMPPAAGAGEGLDRVVFRELLHNTFDVVTEEVLMDRIFCAFDRNNIGVIRLEEWVCGLSVFLRGTADERTAFAFFVYDLNSDGFISRDEMFHLLRNSLVKHPQDEDPDEGVRDLVELALRKMDYDRDGKVSFHDFKSAVSDEPLLLEAFGQCLPTDGASQTFLSTLQDRGV